jgi:hypothetical protein
VKGLPHDWTVQGDDAWALIDDPNCFDKDGDGWSYTEKRDSRTRKWWRSIGKDSTTTDLMALLQHPVMAAAVGLMCLRLISETPGLIIIVLLAVYLFITQKEMTKKQVLKDVEMELGQSVWPSVSQKMQADAREKGGMLGGFLSSFSVVKKLSKEVFLQQVISRSSVQMTPFLSIVRLYDQADDNCYAIHVGGKVFVIASFG